MVRDVLSAVAGPITILWLGFNALVFVLTAGGANGEYIPYVNFPIKFIAMLAN
jgi:hypothetical protein